MDTLRLKEEDIKIAANLIKKGEIVAFPTDTVYGLGADALNEKAVKKIFQAKNRPANRPLSVLIGEKNDINKYALNVPIEAKKLAEKFWPGPLTIILQKKPLFAPAVTMGKPTVGLRMPNHPLTLKLLKASQIPIAAPSANSTGRPSPTQAQHVLDDLENKISAVIDGGETPYGIESTVIDLSNAHRPVIIRPGDISKEQIEKTINHKVDTIEDDKKHYKPDVPVYRVLSPWNEAINKMNLRKEKIGILANDKIIQKYKKQINAYFSLGEIGDINGAKRHFYEGLRYLEKQDITVILIENDQTNMENEAYLNRLKKATEDNIV